MTEMERLTNSIFLGKLKGSGKIRRALVIFADIANKK
jgi:hypothetical protein